MFITLSAITEKNLETKCLTLGNNIINYDMSNKSDIWKAEPIFKKW
jgi:hypothetical protein